VYANEREDVAAVSKDLELLKKKVAK